MPTYKNSNTGDIVEYEQPSPRLEMLPNWHRLDGAEPEEPQEPPAEPVERPAKAASKGDWQAYARSRAQDEEEAAAIDSLTKDELITRYGGDG
ncbi:hypothetical protein ACFUVV_01145 [Streptomyces sp. NPDC057376]|uniref:hypothetical protein n=1 Tax=Streptomyces sp. NPDC057376 TaxID=3346110 RepID=UPI00362CDD10